MKGKRSLKKQQKRQASALAELEELHRRQRADPTKSRTDDEILARAVEIPDLAASPFAAKWAEVAGRALRQSLAGGDLDRLERLLGSLRRTGRPPSVAGLASLADSVLDLAAGRFAVARSRLAALTSMESGSTESGGAELPEGLLPALRNLARHEEADPSLQAARELLQALQVFDPEAVAREFRALRAAAAEPVALLDSAEACLSLLTGLAALEDGLESVWLHANAPALTVALTAPPQLSPPLLAPLRHAVHLRWRTVLQRVAKREGSSGLTALYTAAPKLLALDVEAPQGLQESLAAIRQRTEARQLLSGNRYEKLAELLRSRNRTVSEPSALAALWSLELWTYHRQSREKQEADGPFGWALGNPFGNPSRSPSPEHKALVRLQEMAGEIRQRFPAAQRAEVAGALRAELFDLCEQINFCEHTARAALSLLEHLPSGKIGLLITGVAGAVIDEDRQALAAVQARIAQAGKAQGGDRAVAHRLMTQVAMEDSWSIAATLKELRPLFTDEDWQEITALVAREMVGMLAAAFQECESEEGFPDPDGLRADLDVLRPALAGTPGFAAVEMALDCWRPDRRTAEKRLNRFLADVPGLEGPLVAFRFLERALGPWAPKGPAATSPALAAAIIERIERSGSPWQLWCDDVPALAFVTDSSHRQRLEATIQRLLASPEVREEGRGRLHHAHQSLRQIEELQQMASLPEPRPRRRRQAAGKAKKKKSPAPQLKLDLP